jgi:hypothetical protein
MDHIGETTMNEQDPARRHMQPPIPTHPPDPAAAGEADKVAGDTTPQDPTLHSEGLAGGKPLDNVGGPGLGQPPQGKGAG